MFLFDACMEHDNLQDLENQVRRFCERCSEINSLLQGRGSFDVDYRVEQKLEVQKNEF